MCKFIMDVNKRIFASLLITAIAHICLGQGECDEFVEIPEEDYSRTYATISDGDSGARPLGFIKDTLVYGKNYDGPCHEISGEIGQQVEIKFETVPSMRLCLRSEDGNYERCAEGRFSDCITLPKTATSLVFFCEVSQGCAEGDVNFWLRITKGPPPALDTEEMWCHDLSEEYPESLRPLPPGFFTDKPTEPIGGSSVVVGSFIYSIVCSIVSRLTM